MREPIHLVLYEVSLDPSGEVVERVFTRSPQPNADYLRLKEDHDSSYTVWLDADGKPEREVSYFLGGEEGSVVFPIDGVARLYDEGHDFYTDRAFFSSRETAELVQAACRLAFSLGVKSVEEKVKEGMAKLAEQLLS